MQNYRQRAWAEISLDVLAENVRLIREQLHSGTEFCAVVKADAYGHGEEFICRKLYDLGIRFYAVSSFEEAVRVRRWCPDGEILILGYTAPECAPVLAQKNIIQTILSKEYALELENYLENAPENNLKLKCHIKLDTGMGRIGLPAKEIRDCIRIVGKIKGIQKLKHLKIDGIFTHFAVADEPDPENFAYTENQEENIIHIAESLQKNNIFLRHVHYLNSAGICYHNDPKTGSDSTLARAGIILYGLMPNSTLAVPIPVRPVLSLYSRISHIKTIRPGDCVSYGRTYKAESARRIATVTIGYADGYPRALSNQGEMLVRGIRCPIVGRVCMDQTMIDISGIPEALQQEIQPGEIVTLIGQDHGESITADDIAGLCNTIGYEIVCGISKRIPRIFRENSRIIHEDHLI
ncbi:MAG: alanine racemase [Oscillospiraceae bacterium]|nr:alanine racemase [Oscillospiraceae bacterium]